MLLSEAIVHTSTNQPEVIAILKARDREVAVVEIDKEILDFRAPVAPGRIETEFGADARRPAGVGVALGETERLAAQLTEGQTGSPVEQDVAKRIARAAASE